MATRNAPLVPMGSPPGDAGRAAHAASQRPWQRAAGLSSFADAAEAFLERATHDRGPWLVVALAAGIGSWFTLPDAGAWLQAMTVAIGAGAVGWLHWRGREERTLLRMAALTFGMFFALGIALIWARSEMVGTTPIAKAWIGPVEGRILARQEQPARDRVRLILAVREPGSGRAIKVRLNVPLAGDRPDLVEGAMIRTGARLMPPAPPLVPGAYDFARRAWFEGLAATGGTYGPIVVSQPPPDEGGLANLQRRLAAHVRSQLDGSAGTIAAAFASGDRGAIADADEEAMRDSGLTHLLSISGVHVSALIAGVYFITIRLLALWPWLTLRVRLPVIAAAMGAAGGVAYTLLTGAEVPTIRSCLGAGLVLLALALGREPLSLRMVAVVAGILLLLWPESLVNPSFQMSFASVLAIVALHGAEPVRRFLAPREQTMAARLARHLVILLLAGFVIEAALTPIVVHHFHRAGVYGAFANVIAIPLVTFISMPLIALALLLDLAGLGAPAWWLAGQSLDFMLALAHFVASQPGAVRLMPEIGSAALVVYVFGMLWLALWRGKVRLLGLVPVIAAGASMVLARAPDVMIARDGRQIAVMTSGEQLLVLREGEGYALDSLREAAAVATEPIAIERSPDAQCSADFCVLRIARGGRDWSLLVARSRRYVDAAELVAACAAADIVIAARGLPRSCAPRWLKADRRFLAEHGGVALRLGNDPRVITVAQSQGEHGWWRREDVLPPYLGHPAVVATSPLAAPAR